MENIFKFQKPFDKLLLFILILTLVESQEEAISCRFSNLSVFSGDVDSLLVSSTIIRTQISAGNSVETLVYSRLPVSIQ